MEYKIGEINELEVKRISDLGYNIGNDDDLILMHFKEADSEYKVGDKVLVFLYFDSKKRLSATTKTPFITVSKPGFVKVVDVVSSLGVFIDNNLSKDLLISSDDLPQNINYWPKISDTIFCKLKATSNKLIAKVVSPNELKEIIVSTKELNKFDKVSAFVIKSGKLGVNLITSDYNLIFVFNKHTRRDYHIGEEVLVTINNCLPDGTYNGTLLDSKVKTMKSDSVIIMDYLDLNNGFMKYNFKTDPDIIMEVFNMSKAAFKRACSNLYKERLIDISDEGIYKKKD